MSIQGIIFDLDGTLLDSQLDFAEMRQDMGLTEDAPILESMERMQDSEQQRCNIILAEHEKKGVINARPFPGITDMLQYIAKLEIPMAIVTRNRREFALQMLQQLPGIFEPVIGREQGPIKPDPWALLHIIHTWNLSPQQVLMAGDYRFDLEAGKSAGCRTLWFSHQRTVGSSAWHALADYVISDTCQARERLAEIIHSR